MFTVSWRYRNREEVDVRNDRGERTKIRTKRGLALLLFREGEGDAINKEGLN